METLRPTWTPKGRHKKPSIRHRDLKRPGERHVGALDDMETTMDAIQSVAAR